MTKPTMSIDWSALAAQFGERFDTRTAVRALKTALDPNGLMNPGKIFLD